MFFMRALRPQYAYFLAHRQSNPVHPHGTGTKAEFVLFCFLIIIIHALREKVNTFYAFFLR